MGTTIKIIRALTRVAVLLPSVFYAFSGVAQNSLSERIIQVLEAQDMDMGLNLYKEITEADLGNLPDSVLFDYHYLGGYINSEIPNHEKAIKHLLEAKRLCETSIGVHSTSYQELMRTLGDEYIEIGQYEEALGIFQEGIIKTMYIRNNKTHGFGLLIMRLQRCYEFLGWFNEIPNHLLDAWSFWPKDDEPDGWYSYYPLWKLHMFYRIYEKYENALQTSDTIINFISEQFGSDHPVMAEELYMRGNTLVKMGRYTDAADTFAKGLTILDNNKKDTLELYGLIAGNLLGAIIPIERWPECDTILDTIKNFGSKANNSTIYKNALYSAAKDFNNIGNYSKAIELNSKCLSLDLPERERELLEDQKNTILENQDLEQALPQLEEQFRFLPSGSTDWFDVGFQLSCAYYVVKEYEKNLIVLNKIYEFNIKDISMGKDYYIWLLNNLSGACIESEKYNDALKYTKELWDYINNDCDASDDYLYATLNTLIVTKLKTNSLEQIDVDMIKLESYYRKVYGEDSYEYAIYLHNRGRAYQLQGNYREAKRYYLKSLRLQIDSNLDYEPNTVRYLNEVEEQIINNELDL